MKMFHGFKDDAMGIAVKIPGLELFHGDDDGIMG